MTQPRSRAGLIDMRGTDGPQFPPLAFLWPALAAETASEFASAMAREFISLAVGPGTETGAPEPQFATLTDLAPGHSLVAALQRAGIERVFVTHWRSASLDMRLLAIDNYVADLN